MTIAMAIMAITVTRAAAKMSDIYPAKPPIRRVVAAIYNRRSIYYCGRWIIHNGRRIIDWWRLCINGWG